MMNFKTLAICLALTMLTAPHAQAALRVFACEPEWAALAEEIGGDAIKATSATQAMQDPHYIEARPSLIASMRKADLVVCTGAQLEIGWLPMLLNKANNPTVLPGKNGFLEASAYVKRLDVPTSLDRSQGDVHPQGNPHIQVNPRNIALIAAALGERMASLDSAEAARYTTGLQDFLQRWESATREWDVRAQPLRGKRVVAYHKSWAYLEDWLGLVELATLEPVPGIPPTATHLANVLSQLEAEGGANFILYAPYQSSKPGQWLSDRTKIPLVMLPMTVGGSEETQDLFGVFNEILNQLLGAQ
ncbi:MAG TPA: zinc ABC transporter substrate-binding protein [Xanthomonadales bacterium]|nr:zinc ABC transporter substrate-binding protein [Xanthomonadales bacterium]